MSTTPEIYAHRGARTVAPENTLPAFERALEMGVAGIELDVQATRDGHLVVIHDLQLERTTTGSGRVADKTLADLADVDAGVGFDPSFAGTPIPTLDQVFDLVGDRCVVNVEIKNADPDGGRELEPLVRLIQRRSLQDQVLVSSFNPMALIGMRWYDPSIALGLLYAAEMPVFLRKAWSGPLIAPEALHPHHQLIDYRVVQWAHRRGQYVNSWTVNDVAEAERLASLGVDVIMSDVPDQIIAALSSERP